MATTGTLTISSKRSETTFAYSSADGKYILRGSAQTKTDTTVMTSFNATAYKIGEGTEASCGSVSTNYDQSKGDDGLQFNVYNMSINDLIAVAPIIKECAEALANSDKAASADASSK